MTAPSPPDLEALVAGPSMRSTAASIEELWQDTPLFMRELPEAIEESDAMSALQALVFEGSPNEVARNFKDQGNDYFRGKRYKEAMSFYTQGIEAEPEDHVLMEVLLNNRAACNLALGNNRRVLIDGAASLKLNPRSIKAFYRSAQALFALEKYDEAVDCCDRGLQVEGEAENKSLLELRARSASRIEAKATREAEVKERQRRETEGRLALHMAVKFRGLVVENSPSPPDNPAPLHFDPDVIPENSLPSVPLSPSPTNWVAPPPETPLIIPTFLLYPTHQTSDLISRLCITDPLSLVLAPVLSPPSPYTVASSVLYLETAQKRLLKIPKKMSMEEVFLVARKVVDDGVVLKDGCLSLVVLGKGEEEKAWVSKMKALKDAP